MKKTISIITILLSLAVFSSCSSEVKEVDLSVFSDKLLNEIEYKDVLFEVDDNTITEKFGVDLSQVKSKKVYMSTGATAEEIAVFEASDEDYAATIYDALQERIEVQKGDFADYNPNEMSKLNDSVLEIYGKYVIMCVSDYSDKADELIDAEF